ncbi:MAG: EF-hand domain-containing protein [Parvibaculaceae bacterium]
MQNKTKLALTILALSTLGLGTFVGQAMADRGGRWCGWGGHHGGGMRQLMERYDTNKDGKISQQEIDDNRSEWYARFDTDKDGKLSLKEFEALWVEANRLEMVREFQRLDPNGDAVLTIEEYKGPLSRLVANRDRNGDGVLSREDRRHGARHRDGDDDKSNDRDKPRDDDGDGPSQQ